MTHEKTNVPGFVKDTKYGVVHNMDFSEYQRILDKRKHRKELSDVQQEVQSLKRELNEMNELKQKMAEMEKFFEKFKENQ